MSISNDLENALGRYGSVAGLVEAVREALDAPDPTKPLASNAPIVAFHIIPGDKVFSAWVVLDGRVVLHERNTDGVTLTVAVPLRRVTRVAVTRQPEETKVVIELDGDALSTRTEAEWLERGGTEEGQRQGRQISQATTTRAQYIIVEQVSSETQHASLLALVAALRTRMR